MLEELHVENLLIVEDMTVAFHAGLNVISGETGAGKSLVLGAIGALFGLKLPPAARDSSDLKIEGRFTIDAARREKLADLIGTSGSDELVIRVVKKAQGSQRSYVNGSLISREELAALGRRLIDVHGQKDMARLLTEKEQALALDRYAGSQDLAERFRAAWHAWKDAEKRLLERDAAARALAERLDLLRFQKSELDELAPKDGEFQDIALRHKRAAKASDVAAALASAQALFDGDASGALTAIGRAGKLLERIMDGDPEVGALVDRLSTIESDARELARDFESLGESRASLDEDIGALSERLDALTRAQKKYRTDEKGLVERRRSIGDEILSVQGTLESLEDLDRFTLERKDAVLTIGRELTRVRSAAAKRLKTAARGELDDLRLQSAELEVRCGDPKTAAITEESSPLGLFPPRFMWCGNPGHPFSPIEEAASGGEMSRLMLALKSILLASLDVPVMVFDEIETGVGPRLGDVIGRRLARLSEGHQVLCVTHLPQIAAHAARHLKIEKKTRGGKTTLEIQELKKDARVAELAAMLGGGDRDLATRQAESLIEQARAATEEK